MSARPAAAGGPPSIRTAGLTRRFGAFTAVDGLDLTVAPGEVFGLLGANGAGKTTAIRMLCGLLPPSGGEIEVAGVDMRRHPRRGRRRIGYVAQRFALYGDLSVSENLALQAGLYGLRGEHRRSRLAAVMEQIGLADVAGEPAQALALGFRRRLSLAAALLHQPDTLFLDEPTSGIDPVARQRFWELIYDLAEGGIGILVTTHYMDEAMFCDRLALMHRGRIAAQGSPGALCARPLSTPLLEMHSADSARWYPIVAALPQVREIVPHAGLLRIRLTAGADPAVFASRLRAMAGGSAPALGDIGPAAAELEDVFVDVIEQAEQGSRDGGGGA